MGMDTLSWARRGARVTGLDFSEPAIRVARDLADRIGIDARFEVADVYDAVAVLDRTFDLAYQNLGSLNWHPDLGRWAAVLAELVRPGGRYVLIEKHPLGWVLDDDGDRVGHPYFPVPEGVRFDDDSGSYADRTAPTEHNETLEFSHPISEVLTCLLDAGFVLERFIEHPFTVFPAWPWLEERDEPFRTWWAPDDRPSLPLMYSVVARRPA